MPSVLNLLKERPMFRFLFVLAISSIMSFQAWRTLFNNFSVEMANLESNDIGLIQSIREVPGFLALLTVYILMFIKEHKFAALSVLIMGLGVSLTFLFPSLSGLLITTLIMSFGFHYYETVNQSLILQHFSKQETPHIFASIRRFSALACILTGAVIWGMTKFVSYQGIYITFGVIAILGGLWALKQKPISKNKTPQRKEMIFRKKYSLYYALTFLSGARRQIFVVFAVFLMVKKFNYSISTVTILFMINNLTNFLLLPYIAKAINHFGERNVLICEYTSLIFIFLAYGFTETYWLVGVLYILDNIFFNGSIALKTYFQKIADPRDIAPSMGVSFTINHIAAVIIPFAGGLLWTKGHYITFLLGCCIALFSLVLTFFIPNRNSLAITKK